MRAFVICLERLNATRSDVNIPTYENLFSEVVRLAAIDARTMTATDARIHPFAQGCIHHGINDSSLFIENLSAAACALSHIEAWKRCLESGAPAVIVEDDVHLSSRANIALRSALDDLPSDAHVVSLLYAPIGSNPRKKVASTKRWMRLKGPVLTGMQMYYLTPEGARLLLHGIVPIVTPVGKWIGLHIGTKQVVAYQLRKRLYTVWRFLRDEFNSTLSHGVSFKRYVPNSNWLYGIVIAVLVILVLIFVVRRRRCFAPKEEICAAPDAT